MTPDRIREILAAVESGDLDVEAATETLRSLSFEDLGFAKVDHHRALRRGFPEVVFGPGKTPAQIAAIAARLSGAGHHVLVTKTTEEAFRAVSETLVTAVWHQGASAITIGEPPEPDGGDVAVLSAGTSDIPVAEEAVLTARHLGARVEPLYDVGVAGLHRLLSHRDVLLGADVLVVVAGMDGVLPSVVSGLTRAPVIAVPTSVGYGASFSGLAPLLTMLNACSPGVAVVNIDNGFGAGYLAALLCRPARR
jgi:NCAIR mutase (PurE)-related protein